MLEERALPSGLGLLLPTLAITLFNDTNLLQAQHDQINSDLATASQHVAAASNRAARQREVAEHSAQLRNDFQQFGATASLFQADATNVSNLLFVTVLSGALRPSDAGLFFGTFQQVVAAVNEGTALSNGISDEMAQTNAIFHSR